MLTDHRMWTPDRSPSSLTQVGSHCFLGDIPSPGFLSRTRLRQGGELGRSRAARLHTRVGSGRPRSRPRWALCSPVLPLSPLPGCGSPHPCLFHGGVRATCGGQGHSSADPRLARSPHGAAPVCFPLGHSPTLVQGRDDLLGLSWPPSRARRQHGVLVLRPSTAGGWPAALASCHVASHTAGP